MAACRGASGDNFFEGDAGTGKGDAGNPFATGGEVDGGEKPPTRVDGGSSGGGNSGGASSTGGGTTGGGTTGGSTTGGSTTGGSTTGGGTTSGTTTGGSTTGGGTSGAPGDTCAADGECQGGIDALCIPSTDWPGGYCTVTPCDVGTCPQGSDCYELAEGATACLQTCTGAGSCRSGYTCHSAAGACVPACTSNADCTAPATCNLGTGECGP